MNEKELVLVIPSNNVNGNTIHTEGDMLKKIKAYGFFKERGQVEDAPIYRQIIPYVVLTCKGKYFVTQRLAGDKRLTGRTSLGTGGHINLVDSENKTMVDNYITNCIVRELHEETTVDTIDKLEFVKCFTDDTDEVSKVHLCMLYTAELPEECAIKETDKLEGKWLTKEEITKDIYNNFENWSKITYEILFGKFKTPRKRRTKKTTEVTDEDK